MKRICCKPKPLTAKRVAELRLLIEVNRCSTPPGLQHQWQQGIGMDPNSFGGVLEWMECVKCHKFYFT